MIRVLRGPFLGIAIMCVISAVGSSKLSRYSQHTTYFTLAAGLFFFLAILGFLAPSGDPPTEGRASETKLKDKIDSFGDDIRDHSSDDGEKH